MMILFKKKRLISSGSLSYLAWKKFKKNKLGLASLIFIIFCIAVSLLGYLITPDKSPYANTQILEINRQKPGFSVNMLLINKDETVPEKGILNTMLFGKNNEFTFIPFTTYSFEEDKMTIAIFESQETERNETFLLYDIINSYEENENVDTQKENINNKKAENSFMDLQEIIIKKNINRRHYLLGTDQFGRDLLSRLIIGTRVSLSVGFISVAISILIGVFIGALGGYFRGRTDEMVMWLINVVWSIPTLLLVIAITFALGRGFWQIFVAVGLTMWVEVARIVRGQIISLREKEFIEAGYSLGFSDFRIITKHILPNVLSPVIVISAANFASAILIEAGLSFLGIGVQPPMPSWGGMIREYYSFIILDSAYLAIVPGVAIVVLVLAFMSLGNALRDALDVKMTD